MDAVHASHKFGCKKPLAIERHRVYGYSAYNHKLIENTAGAADRVVIIYPSCCSGLSCAQQTAACITATFKKHLVPSIAVDVVASTAVAAMQHCCVGGTAAAM